MIEYIIEDILNEMTPHLSHDQLEQLSNVLYINFHNKEIKEECYELEATGTDGDIGKVKMFVASKKAVNRKNNTLKQYTDEIKRMLDFLGKRLEDITAMDLRYYYGIMREVKKIKASTMQTRLHYLSSFWDFLTIENLVPNNPVRQVGTVMLEKTLKKPFSAEELEKLRVNCTTLRNRALMEFLYSTGVRVSELASLNVKDIEMGKQELIVYGKGSKERKVYLTDNAKFYLKRYLRCRLEQEKLTEEELENRPLFVSCSKPFNRLTVAGIQYMLRSLGRQAHVENVHPHRFRRTIATDLLSRGMPIEQVKEYLGHEKLDTTMIYCTVKEQNVRESFRKYA